MSAFDEPTACFIFCSEGLVSAEFLHFSVQSDWTSCRERAVVSERHAELHRRSG